MRWTTCGASRRITYSACHKKRDQVGAREAVPHLVSHQLGAPPPISYILVHRWAAQITATTMGQSEGWGWGRSGGGIMTAAWLQRRTRRINWPGGFNNSPRSGQYGQELANLQLATVAAVAAPTESYKSQLWLLPRLKTVARQVAGCQRRLQVVSMKYMCRLHFE